MNRLVRLLVAVAVAITPSTARAHAHLTRSEPAAGSHVPTPPTVIRLWFSERPEIAMTLGVLKDAMGTRYSLSPALRDGSSELEVDLPVAVTLPPGTYTLAWRTSAADGHPSHGSFSFTVASPAGSVPNTPSAAATGPMTAGSVRPQTNAKVSADSDSTITDDMNAAASPANALARALLFVGILALIGAVSFKNIVVGRAAGLTDKMVSRLTTGAALVGLIAAIVVVAAAMLRLYLELGMMNAMPDMPQMKGMTYLDMITRTRWGFAFDLQIVGAAVAFIGFAVAASGKRFGWHVASLAAIVLAITPALSGHAGSSPRLASLLIAADWLHVLGASAWLGSLLLVMVIGLPAAMSLEGNNRWSSVASLVNSFSPLALISASVVAGTGVFAAWIHLERLPALWQTDYGQALLVKLALVAITLATGAYNFKRVQPRLAEEAGTLRLRKSATVELSIGVLVIVATGVLTGISP